MAGIRVKPELKQHMKDIAKVLSIDEKLLKAADKTAENDELFCPGFAVSGQSEGPPLETLSGLSRYIRHCERILSADQWVKEEKVYGSQSVYEEIEKITDVFPFVTCRKIGSSVLGKPLYELKIGADTAERKVHVNASFHANEWITTSVALKWCKEYCAALCENKTVFGHSALDIFSRTSLSFVPLVNPDGVDLVLYGCEDLSEKNEFLNELNEQRPDFREWKANINGVDLNKHFPSNWDIEQRRKPKAPSYRDFPGTAPLTEPEAQAMHRLITKQPPDRLIALHTQGEEIYWGYEGCEPEQSSRMIREFEAISGNRYQGVKTIDSHAGFRDWFIQQYGKEGYTIELGKGKNPLPFHQFADIYQATEGILWRSLVF
ncbi:MULTISPECIES: M14 family metallopeptidase [Bacillus]|uniref:M14 family metallopeptidase n=1 Tax=Bacillus TaxID=1386 RepID=UPI00042E301C|nr:MULTISPECIES: M14 family metallocarboxypeptidase [Bacillus amyloliquefaciens group]AHK49843.1 hypothetical protein AJ82_13115 [Bacillus velezensis TrigoCor1448]MBW7977451.1 hypothetical protein [Bacillus velezensis]MCM3106490.1 M14 family metallocarboxypeptidase [Bacillus velezensis]MCR4365273.1 M14 family metallocarboxypeptidase [Bacillus amyloliquefaciens]MCV3199627.1 M14 family metallocarboxypeptidase [Bacillus velezensis]